MFLVILSLATLIHLSPEVHCGQSKEILHQKKFPPCKACKVFVDSFKKGIEQTSKGKFEGGDAAWEEQKLGSYANSEIRLTEIQENICSDVEEGKDQCYFIHEENDSILEEWWFHKQKEVPDIFEYFCINRLELCCPDYHFGKKCAPCEGYPDNICSNNGKCNGSGTRRGNGTCICNAGYSSEKCDQCSDGYFESYRDEKKLICSKCHSSCDGPCTKAGTTGCIKCKEGWVLDDDKGCLDMNECDSSKSPCRVEQFCVNTEGSYHCINCDKSCKSCTGDGISNCKECANGYTMRDNICVDAEEESRKQNINITRYLFYLGLSIATFILFNRNTVLAAFLGIAVAIYIFTSEYFQTLSLPEDVTLLHTTPK
ncbi:cysteine-rich with EGF-like domain protein 2 [Coccinella septempunctata]|uniref:cysteine-rich with EGF-like domain protein 2 n=1 Tax=Coccinella septempunctata TaxID=41139 RepID=UPI001D077BBE|nr:cysteine-rich with EGF-like domain protein 2 [Coccinella septempunctata]